MVNLSKNKNLLGLIAFFCIVGFVGSSFAESNGAPQMIPDGKIHVYDDKQKIAEVTAESPLPQGKILKVEGKCGIKMDSLFLVATDKSALIVRTEKRGQELHVKDGKVFFGITAINDPISFFTPKGSVVAQQVMLKASSQSPILEGYVDVSEKEAEIGVISGGSMVISTEDGAITVNEGERFILAQATLGGSGAGAAAATGGTAAGAGAAAMTGGTVGAITGGIIGATLITAGVVSANDDKTVSKKSP